MLTLSQLCPGVEPFEPDSLVYLVQSQSRSEVKQKVDFTAWGGFGECGCEHFLCRIAPLLREGKRPTDAMECPHIKRARRYLALEAIQAIIRRRENEAQTNKKTNRPLYQNEDCPY